MKLTLTPILMAAGIAGLFIAHATAQEHCTIANIPFTFIVNKTMMPAGQYRLSQWGASGSAFGLRNAAGRTIFVLLGIHEGGKRREAHITFACNGKECVLARIAPAGSSTEYSLGRDSVERNLHHRFGIASMISIKLTTH